MIRILSSVFAAMILIVSIGCATHPYSKCGPMGYGPCGPALMSGCDILPCEPAPCGPPPCGPPPCEPVSCVPAPCGPPPCEPVPCGPPPCEPAPCGPISCAPAMCNNNACPPGSYAGCPCNTCNNQAAGLAGPFAGSGMICPPAPLLRPPHLKLARPAFCNRNLDDESELYVTRGPRDFFDPNPNKIRY